MENWEPVPSWENLYEVSDLGNVRSLERRIEYTNHKGDRCTRTFKPRLLQPKPNKRTGRRTVRLFESRDGEVVRQKWVTVYKLVWLAFVGPIPTDVTIDHIDELPNNDRLDNLQLMARPDNARKSRKLKPHSKGSAHHNSKLTEPVVRNQVRPRLAKGETIASIARICGVGETAIRDIRDGKTWVGVE